MGLSLLVGPRCPAFQQVSNQGCNSFNFLRRLILISRVLNWNKSQTCSVKRAGGVKALVGVFWPGDQTLVIEDFRRERTDVWMESPGLSQEQPLVRADRRASV